MDRCSSLAPGSALKGRKLDRCSPFDADALTLKILCVRSKAMASDARHASRNRRTGPSLEVRPNDTSPGLHSKLRSYGIIPDSVATNRTRAVHDRWRGWLPNELIGQVFVVRYGSPNEIRLVPRIMDCQYRWIEGHNRAMIKQMGGSAGNDRGSAAWERFLDRKRKSSRYSTRGDQETHRKNTALTPLR
jgi:hypothetical protein